MNNEYYINELYGTLKLGFVPGKSVTQNQQ